MNTLTKLALGLLGHLNALPASGSALATRTLPPPCTTGGAPLMDAISRRESQRAFSSGALPEQTLSDLLWAAAGINRPGLGGRTAPSAMNSQEVQLFVALPEGLFRYDPAAQREAYAFTAAGAMAQNVYLYCASAGLATVIRAWFDRQALSRAMNLGADEQLLLAQTVGTVATSV